MDRKLSLAGRICPGLATATALLGLVAIRLGGCAPAPRPAPPPPPHAALPVTPAPPAPPPAVAAESCAAPGWEAAARLNTSSLTGLYWNPFGRAEVGWRIYAPMIERELGAACAPQTPAFARALADWQRRQGFPGDGVVSELAFLRMKGVMQSRRPFVLLVAEGVCAAPADEARLATVPVADSLGTRPVMLRPRALAAYRRMAAAARAEVPALAADPDLLKIFSGYRSPTYDAARCLTENNCNGLVRASCSPHRTGLAMDLYLGHAPGYTADASADANRLYLTEGPAYRWLVANADRFGFANYPFEPWHWEFTEEAPRRPPPGSAPITPSPGISAAGSLAQSSRSAGP